MNYYQKLAQDSGFSMPNFRMFMTDKNKCAQDAAMVTTPNAGVPVEYTAYLDPMVIEILTAVRNARALFGEVKKGDWTTPYAKFRTTEMVGETGPYADYNAGPTSDVNYTFPNREQYLFQTTVQYGDYEQAVSSAARLNLASDKQKSAAKTIDVDANKFYLYGVAGRGIYGALNDPNLPAALVATNGASGSATWAKKTTNEIYKDVLDMFKTLVKNSGGNISIDSKLILAVSPDNMVDLATSTEYNVSVKDMLDKYFGNNLTYVQIPELRSLTTGNMAYMVCPNVDGTPTGEYGFSIKFQAGRVIPKESSYTQKFVSSTYGCVIYRPFAVATMTGI